MRESVNMLCDRLNKRSNNKESVELVLTWNKVFFTGTDDTVRRKRRFRLIGVVGIEERKDRPVPLAEHLGKPSRLLHHLLDLLIWGDRGLQTPSFL